MEITGCKVRAVGWVVHNLPAHSTITGHESGWQCGCSDFVVLEYIKKHLAGKRFAADAEVKQAVASWLQTLDTIFICARIQALEPQMCKCECD
jgi:hypothetical protein